MVLAKSSEAQSLFSEMSELIRAREFGFGAASDPAAEAICPVSAPMVPHKVLSERKHKSTPGGWKHVGWMELGCSMRGQQYLSCGINTSANCRSGVFYALGALKGDGGPQHFELNASAPDVDGKSVLVAAPELVDSDTPASAWWRF